MDFKEPCKGETGFTDCVALAGLFIYSILTQGFGRLAAFTLGFAVPRFQR
jgi:hypothetical protein